MKYFIADTHFDHENIIRLSNRPFASIEEMNEALITNWNNTVKVTDEVYILGDFLFRSSGSSATDILKKLNGKKYLIKGNHEKYLEDKSFDKNQFVWVKDYFEFKEDGVNFVLFHYPILEWNGFYRKSVHLYGHVHNNNTEYFEKVMDKRALNVGVDIINFTPISIDDVLKRTNYGNKQKKEENLCLINLIN